MAVKVIMERKVLPGRELELDQLLRELRARALKRGGYISGETLVSAFHPAIFLVISNWLTIKDWKAWEGDPERQEIIAKIDALLTEPVTSSVWLEQAGVPVAAV